MKALSRIESETDTKKALLRVEPGTDTNGGAGAQ